MAIKYVCYSMNAIMWYLHDVMWQLNVTTSCIANMQVIESASGDHDLDINVPNRASVLMDPFIYMVRASSRLLRICVLLFVRKAIFPHCMLVHVVTLRETTLATQKGLTVGINTTQNCSLISRSTSSFSHHFQHIPQATKIVLKQGYTICSSNQREHN